MFVPSPTTTLINKLVPPLLHILFSLETSRRIGWIYIILSQEPHSPYFEVTAISKRTFQLHQPWELPPSTASVLLATGDGLRKKPWFHLGQFPGISGQGKWTSVFLSWGVWATWEEECWHISQYGAKPAWKNEANIQIKQRWDGERVFATFKTPFLLSLKYSCTPTHDHLSQSIPFLFEVVLILFRIHATGYCRETPPDKASWWGAAVNRDPSAGPKVQHPLGGAQAKKIRGAKFSWYHREEERACIVYVSTAIKPHNYLQHSAS